MFDEFEEDNTKTKNFQPWWFSSLARHLITEVPSERWIESRRVWCINRSGGGEPPVAIPI